MRRDRGKWIQPTYRAEEMERLALLLTNAKLILQKCILFCGFDVLQLLLLACGFSKMHQCNGGHQVFYFSFHVWMQVSRGHCTIKEIKTNRKTG